MSSQITVHVNFYGLLREIAGQKSKKMKLESAWLEDLLEMLSVEFDKPLKQLLLFSEPSQINLFLNHVIIPAQNIVKIELRDGDQIDLFTPVSGG